MIWAVYFKGGPRNLRSRLYVTAPSAAVARARIANTYPGWTVYRVSLCRIRLDPEDYL